MKTIQAKLCLLGDFSVGKTSLVRRYVEGYFDDRYLSTIGVKISRKRILKDTIQLNLLIWDLAGSEDFKKYENSYLRGAAGALIVCDLTRAATFECLPRYYRQIRQVNPDAFAVFVGNKLDLIPKHAPFINPIADFAAECGMPHILTSAKTGEQTEAAFLAAGDLILSALESHG